jgi:hypothetical protein
MQHQWRLCRTLQEHRDGQRRWDRTYQLLLQWAQTPDTPPSEPSQRPSVAVQPPLTRPLEVSHASRDLCPGLDPAANTDPDH